MQGEMNSCQISCPSQDMLQNVEDSGPYEKIMHLLTSQYRPMHVYSELSHCFHCGLLPGKKKSLPGQISAKRNATNSLQKTLHVALWESGFEILGNHNTQAKTGTISFLSLSLKVVSTFQIIFSPTPTSYITVNW